jgi:hypothetical protein
MIDSFAFRGSRHLIGVIILSSIDYSEPNWFSGIDEQFDGISANFALMVLSLDTFVNTSLRYIIAFREVEIENPIDQDCPKILIFRQCLDDIAEWWNECNAYYMNIETVHHLVEYQNDVKLVTRNCLKRTD